MELDEIVEEGRIFDQLKCDSKKQALQTLAQHAAEVAGLDEREIMRLLLEREKLGSTGVGHGVAIPHARLNTVSKPTGFMARCTHPIEFDSVDGEPVDLIFLLLAPECTGNKHIRALAKVSRILRDPERRSELRHAGNSREMLDVLAAGTPGKKAPQSARAHAAV